MESVHVFRYDPAQCKWECLPDMASPRDYFAAVCKGGKVFVLGGNYDDRNCLDSVEYYTPEDNMWRYSLAIHFLCALKNCILC